MVADLLAPRSPDSFLRRGCLPVVSAASDLLVNLVAVFIVFVARLLGFDAYSRGIRLFRRLPISVRRLRGAATILVYTDCDDELHTAKALAAGLEERINTTDRQVRVTVVRDGVDLARWPYPADGVIAILILLTDVTQLSVNPRERGRVQRRLIRYVHRGGCLILGHDVIYRRSRNERLQRIAGGSLDDFYREDGPTAYVKVDSGPRVTSNRRLLEALPDSIELGDNEVIIGQWDADVEYLYRWEKDPDIPLVTRRPVGRGRVFWINSGDTSAKGPPRSLARPEPSLVQLLVNLVIH